MAPNFGIDSATNKMTITTTDLNTQRFHVKSEKKIQGTYTLCALTCISYVKYIAQNKTGSAQDVVSKIWRVFEQINWLFIKENILRVDSMIALTQIFQGSVLDKVQGAP